MIMMQKCSLGTLMCVRTDRDAKRTSFRLEILDLIYAMKWVHYSPTPNLRLKTANLSGLIFQKPKNGTLWLATKDVWRKLNMRSASGKYSFQHAYCVTVSMENIIVVSDKNFREFTEQYEVLSKNGPRGIDWGKVQADGYDGIRLMPSALQYRQYADEEELKSFRFLWIDTFFIPSLAVWNMKAVKEFRQVF